MAGGSGQATLEGRCPPPGSPQLLGQIVPLFRGEIEAKAHTPGKSNKCWQLQGQQVWATAVLEAGLAEDGLAVGMLGDFGQAPEYL